MCSNVLKLHHYTLQLNRFTPVQNIRTPNTSLTFSFQNAPRRTDNQISRITTRLNLPGDRLELTASRYVHSY